MSTIYTIMSPKISSTESRQLSLVAETGLRDEGNKAVTHCIVETANCKEDQGRNSTCQKVHQGGLPRTVGPHNRDAAAHIDADVQLFQAEILAAWVLEVHVVQLDEGMSTQLCGFWELKVHCVVGPFPRSSRLVGVFCIVILFALILPLLGILCILLNLQKMKVKGRSCAFLNLPGMNDRSLIALILAHLFCLAQCIPEVQCQLGLGKQC